MAFFFCSNKVFTIFSHKPYLLAYISTDGAVGIAPYRKANVVSSSKFVLLMWRITLLIVMLLGAATSSINCDTMNLITIGRNILRRIEDRVKVFVKMMRISSGCITVDLMVTQRCIQDITYMDWRLFKINNKDTRANCLQCWLWMGIYPQDHQPVLARLPTYIPTENVTKLFWCFQDVQKWNIELKWVKIEPTQ